MELISGDDGDHDDDGGDGGGDHKDQEVESESLRAQLHFTPFQKG